MLALVLAAFGGITWLLHNTLNAKVPNAYMDEIFHVPQSQLYCEGNYSYWDPKITTPPGLYLVSSTFSYISGKPCDVQFLRTTNYIFSLLNLILIFLIRSRIVTKTPSYITALESLTIAVLPVSYFSGLLYYTDAGCLFFILSMYLLSILDWHLLAAILGFASLWFRQTSIAWVFFTAAAKCFLILERRAPYGKVRKLVSKSIKYRQLFGLLLGAFCEILITCWAYIIVGMAFVAFLVYNGSIVLGDKSAHEAAPHLMQAFYFATFTGFHAFPYFISKESIVGFLEKARSKILLLLVSVAVSVLIVESFSMAHPYLLADNRHYTFYIWSRFLSKRLFRIALVPAYLYCIFVTKQQLYQVTGFLFTAAFFLCTYMCVIPQGLIEFRYFIVPFTLWRLHVKPRGLLWCLLELLSSIVINILTLRLFLNKTFEWPSEPGVMQRFMW